MEDFIEVIDWIPMSNVHDNNYKYSMQSHKPTFKNIHEYWDDLSAKETEYATAIVMSIAENNIKSWIYEVHGYPFFNDGTAAWLSGYEFDALVDLTNDLLEGKYGMESWRSVFNVR